MFIDVSYEQYAFVCKTIVNPIRLKIIEIIGPSKKNVSELQSELGITMSNLSNHLNSLHNAGILVREKKGNFIYYSLMEPELVEVIKKMKMVIHSIALKKNQIITNSNPHEE